MNHAGNPVDPDAELDWSWDWSEWLAPTETISSKSVVATEGTATIATPTESAGVVTAFVSDPVGDATTGRVTLRCRITTSAGRVDDRSILLIPVER